METIRSFIALDMPSEVMETVRRSQQALRQGGLRLRWVRSENVHLTLRFLGEILPGKIVGIRNAVESTAANSEPFSLQVSGLGVFPGRGAPKVVWLGLAGELDGLAGVYGRLSASLAGQGILPEKRPFRGHLTVGRVRGREDAALIRKRVSSLADIESRPFMVHRICLYKSELTPAGAVYSLLATAELGGKKERNGYPEDGIFNLEK